MLFRFWVYCPMLATTTKAKCDYHTQPNAIAIEKSWLLKFGGFAMNKAECRERIVELKFSTSFSPPLFVFLSLSFFASCLFSFFHVFIRWLFWNGVAVNSIKCRRSCCCQPSSICCLFFLLFSYFFPSSGEHSHLSASFCTQSHKYTNKMKNKSFKPLWAHTKHEFLRETKSLQMFKSFLFHVLSRSLVLFSFELIFSLLLSTISPLCSSALCG